MTYFGFDHHKRWTQTVAMDEQGRVLCEARVLNDSGSLKHFLRGLPKPWKGVVEAGPTWGWVYDTLSHDVAPYWIRGVCRRKAAAAS